MPKGKYIRRPIPVGKIGLINREARKIIANIAESKNLNRCEINLDGCTKYIFLAPAHRHKRIWYKGDLKLLSDFNQWVCACTNCHQKIEYDGELTKTVFKKLRENET